MTFYRRLAAALFLLPFAAALHAQPRVPLTIDVPLPGVTAYDPAIPTTDAVLGHLVGEKHTPPHEVVEFFEAVAAASDRVVLREHGRTYEGRPLIHAVVTSAANHARLDAIQDANVRLSEAPDAVSDADLAGMPAVVLMGYSIHGNEASGTEAALLLLYHLAAGQGPAVDAVLDNTVILLDPLFNPDGRDRFTDWANRNRGAVATSDPYDREHNEPWPGGRTNHYWFDLNRDWLPAQHPESQSRLDVFHAWRPQVLTDYHEMGGNSTFFFQPGIPSRTNPNTPALNQHLTGRIADVNARRLDDIGSLYYTRESFDDFYYGKGSTYPDINGAVGILFEQASSRALVSETDNGLLDYAFTVRNQFVASLGTLEAIADPALRTDLLRHMRDFYAEAPAIARANDVKAYVFSLERDRTKTQALAQMLQRHRIRLHTLARDVEADGQTFRAGQAYVVPMDQQQVRLLKGIMEPMTSFEDSLFYDVSTWTLPLAFDVDYAELRRDVGALLGAEVGAVTMDGGAVVGGRSDLAYLLGWGRYFAPRALYKLQQAGLRPRLTNAPFTALVDGAVQQFPRGTIVVPVVSPEGRRDDVHALVQQIAAEDHVQVWAAGSGLTPDGPDLGGNSTSVLEMPRVAILTGPGASSAPAGETWHLLSERYRMPVSLLDTDMVQRADLSRYNTLVFAGGSYGDVDVEAVRAWVRGGGRIVAFGSGAAWAMRNGFAELETKEVELDSLFRDLPYDQVRTAYGAQVIGGSIFEARLDLTHPLAYGQAPTIPFFRSASTFYEPADQPGTNVAVYTEEPLLSGYISDERLGVAGGSAAVVARGYGRGHVILFMDNPNFRAFWYGTNGLFMNALFLGGTF